MIIDDLKPQAKITTLLGIFVLLFTTLQKLKLLKFSASFAL